MNSRGTTRRRRKLISRSNTISSIKNDASRIGIISGPPASSISNKLRVGMRRAGGRGEY